MAARGRARRAADPEGARLKDLEWKRSNLDKTRSYKTRWRNNNLDACRAKRKEKYAASKEKELDMSRAYKRKNAQQIAEAAKQRLADNPEINRAARSLRRAREKNAVPKWADSKKIKAVYLEATRLTLETGIVHHVDHIVPLQSDFVCGLHWHANLQPIPARDNLVKLNRTWPHEVAFLNQEAA